MQNLNDATAPQILVLSPEEVNETPGFNGRFTVPNQGFIRRLALDILEKSSIGEDGSLISGQMATVGIHPDRSMKYGHRRLMAIELINAAGDEGPAPVEAGPGEPTAEESQAAIVAQLERLKISPIDLDSGAFTFPVLATIVPQSDDPLSELDVNVAENGARDPMSDMDWSTVCANYKAQGLSASQIAERLGKFRPTGNDKPSASWVMHMLEVRECAPEIQMKIHLGELGVWSALQILRNSKNAATPDATPEETMKAQQNALQQMIGEDGKIDRKRAREVNRVMSNERGAKTTKTISELRQLLARKDAAGSRRAKFLNAWIEGNVSNARLEAFLEDGAEAPEDKPKKGGKAKPEAAAKGEAKQGKKAKPAKKGSKAKPEIDEATGARKPPLKDKAKSARKPKAAPVADVVDPDEDPQLGAQGEAEMTAEQADAALLEESQEAPSDSEGEPAGE